MKQFLYDFFNDKETFEKHMGSIFILLLMVLGIMFFAAFITMVNVGASK